MTHNFPNFDLKLIGNKLYYFKSSDSNQALSPGELGWFASPGKIYQTAFNEANQQLLGISTSAPAVGSLISNQLSIFARGADAAFWHRQWKDGVWSDWESLGEEFTSAPAVVAWPGVRLDVFGKKYDTYLLYNSFDGTSWSGSWTFLGGRMMDETIHAYWRNGVLYVFIRGLDGQIYQGTWNSFRLGTDSPV